MLKIALFSFSLILLHSSNIRSQDSSIQITSNQFETDGSILIANWKAIAGDDFRWLVDTLLFQDWQEINSNQISAQTLSNWQGIGWFKALVKVDKALVDAPIPFQFVENNGALEFYLDEKLIDRLGIISNIEEDNIAELDQHAQILQIPDTTWHTLTIRYANYKSKNFEKIGLLSGFELKLYNYDEYLRAEIEHEKAHTHIISIIVFLASLSVVHLLLLIFYPAGQKNFYFTFIAASIAVFALSGNTTLLFSNPESLIYATYIMDFAWLFGYLCILKFSYSFTEKTSPKILFVVLITALFVTISSIFNLFDIALIRSILSVFILIEYLRVIAFQKYQKKPVDILLIGFAVFALLIYLHRDTLQISWELGFPFLRNTNAITVLTASISFYLLRDFAKAQTKLEYKYLEVKHLSERSVDQERRNKEKEFKQKLLEAENDRKTAELEESRALQLSMLPAEIPKSSFWDIAAKMETAYEVGGDYYDFYEVSTDEFVAAVGDATGHGMKAGIIVATVKSNFHSTIGSSSLLDTLKKISDGIRNLDIKMLYMGLMLFRAKKHQLTFTSAGMPQAFWYKVSEKRVIELIVKAMPLGVPVDFPYLERTIDAQKGDVLLIVSDGLVELFNRKREQLGAAAIKEFLKENAENDSNLILKNIFQLKENWRNSAPQEDDVTILVMKAI